MTLEELKRMSDEANSSMWSYSSKTYSVRKTKGDYAHEFMLKIIEAGCMSVRDTVSLAWSMAEEHMRRLAEEEKATEGPLVATNEPLPQPAPSE